MYTWYLPEDDPRRGHLIIETNKPHPIEGERASQARTLLEAAQAAARTQGDEFLLRGVGFPEGDLDFRGEVMSTSMGREFVLRQIAPILPGFSSTSLPIPRHYATMMLDPQLSAGGLVLVLGPAGAGKTTTASAMVVERLKKYGGVAVAVEDPPDYTALAGRHGDGYCLQCAVPTDKRYRDVIRQALRCYPPSNGRAMLFIGEIRDADAAAEALTSSVNGHLVVTTVHAADIPSGLKRIVAFAQNTLGLSAARDILASSFRLALYQRFKNSMLAMTGLQNIDYPPARGLVARLREGAFDTLTADIDAQRPDPRRALPQEV